MNAKFDIRFCALAAVLVSVNGCVVSDINVKMAEGSGGNPGVGGSSQANDSTATGGNESVGGSASGGTVSTVGSNATGGTKALGGSTHTGGLAATGGLTASGGTKSAGGATGSTPAGGTATTGGTKSSGGTSGSTPPGTVLVTGGTSSVTGTTSLGGSTNGVGGTTAAPSSCGFKQSCGPIDYRCNDGTCVPPSSRCDGMSQCATGEDEIGCWLETLSCGRCAWYNCDSEYTDCADSTTSNCMTEFKAVQGCALARQAGVWPGQSGPELYSASQVAGCASSITSQNVSLGAQAKTLVNCLLAAPNNCTAKCFDSAAQEPQLANPNGWVGGDSATHTDDPMGFQAGWFAYTDGYSCPDFSTIPSVNPCCGGKCCLHGKTFVDSSFNKWGCGLGFDFVSSGTATVDPSQYAGPADGLLVRVTGNLGALTLRVVYTQSSAVSLKSSPFSEITRTGEYVADFLGSAYPDWCTSENCTGAYGDPVVSKPYGVRFEIVGGSSASAYDFCIESVRPYAPDGWTCDQSYYGTGDGCDCGCGIPDPDCVTGTGCSQSSCNAVGCANCYNSTGNNIYCPTMSSGGA